MIEHRSQPATLAIVPRIRHTPSVVRRIARSTVREKDLWKILYIDQGYIQEYKKLKVIIVVAVAVKTTIATFVSRSTRVGVIPRATPGL
jgi:hypothetical protein